MAEPQTPDQPAAEEKLYTLSEISQRTGISMPTLQRYKKSYQDRLPSVGSGRKQRYPEHALPVFEEIRTENAGRRGRPRKSAAAGASRAARKPGRRPGRPGRRPAAAPGRRAGAAARGAGGAAAGRRPAGRRPGRPAGAAARRGRPAARRGRPPGRAAAGRPGRPRKAAAGPGRPRRATGRVGRPAGAGRRAAGGKRRGTEGLLTLTEISKTTGISYPTLVRYVRLYSNRLPHAGQGRARRFYPEAVEVFRSLRQQSGRGGRRPKGAAGNGRRRAAGGARRGRPPARRGRPPGRRGRPPKSAAAGVGSRLEAMLVERVRDLERFKQAIERQFGDLVRGLQRLR
jgi:predicted DNA-binding transcriptional regulator AlpA